MLNFDKDTIAQLDEQDVNSQQLAETPKEVVLPSEDSSDNDSVVGGDNSSVVKDDEVDDFFNSNSKSDESLDDLDLDDLDPEVTATETNPEETKAEVTKAEETKEEEPKEAEPKAAEPKEVTKEEPKEVPKEEPKEEPKEKPIVKPIVEEPKVELQVITDVDEIDDFDTPTVEPETTNVKGKQKTVYYITDTVNGQKIKVKITDLIGNPDKLALLTINKNFATIVNNLKPSILVKILNSNLFEKPDHQNFAETLTLAFAKKIIAFDYNDEEYKSFILKLIHLVKNNEIYLSIIDKLAEQSKIGILRDVLLDPNSEDRFFNKDNNNLTDIGKALINHIKNYIIKLKECKNREEQTISAEQRQVLNLKNFIAKMNLPETKLDDKRKEAIIDELLQKTDGTPSISLTVISCALGEIVRVDNHQDSLTNTETQLINLITQRGKNATPKSKGLLIANILKDIDFNKTPNWGAALIEKLKESFGEEALYWALPYLVNSATSLCSAGNTIIQRINSNINNEHLGTILDVINANKNNCATAVLYALTSTSFGKIGTFDLLTNKNLKEKIYSNNQLTFAGKAIVTKILSLYQQAVNENQDIKTNLFNTIASKLIEINGDDGNFMDAIIKELITQCYQSNKPDLLNDIVKSLNENNNDTNKSVRNRVIDDMLFYGLIDLNTLNNMKDSLKGYNNFGISIDDTGKLTVNANTYLTSISIETGISDRKPYNYKRISRKNIFFLLRHDTSLRKDDDFNDTGRNIFKKLFWNNNYEDKKNYRTDKYKIGYLSECLEDLDLTQENDRQLLLMLVKNSQITYLNIHQRTYDIVPKLFADYIRDKDISGQFKTDFINAILNKILSVTYDTFEDATLAHTQDWNIRKQGELLRDFLLNLIDTENNEFLKEDGLVEETINQIKDQDLLVQLCLSICTYADTDKANNGIYTTKYKEELTPTMKMIIRNLDKKNYQKLIDKLIASKNTNAINAKDCISKYRNTLNTTSS